jgi:predicted deacylase
MEGQGEGHASDGDIEGNTMGQRVLLHMTAPLREDFDIPYHAIGAHLGPPRAAFVAGLRGDELNGVFVLARLADFLNGVETSRHPTLQLCQHVIIIPAVNILGLNTYSRYWPFDNTDIDRMFPGYDAGETTQRIAHAVLEVTRAAHYRVDLHSSSHDFEELPQVRLFDPTTDERTTARLFGLPAVIESAVGAVFAATLGHAWKTCGGENFVIQAGQAGNLQLPHCERVFRALVGFLQRLGILQGASPSSEHDDDVHVFGINQTTSLVAETAGLFISHLEVGRWLQAGDLIGQVFDGFDGQLRAEIKAPVVGLLSGVRRQPLLFEGDLIARLQTR